MFSITVEMEDRQTAISRKAENIFFIVGYPKMFYIWGGIVSVAALEMSKTIHTHRAPTNNNGIKVRRSIVDMKTENAGNI